MTEKELLLKYPIQKFGEIHIERKINYVISGEFDENNIADLGWKIYLEHSCDEWVIGNIIEAEKFHRDLGEALEYCRNNP